MILAEDLWAVLVLVTYVPVRLTYDIIVNCWWRLKGTTRRHAQSCLPENYNVSAHVFDIKWKRSTIFGRVFDSSPPATSQFFLTHNCFTDPNIVLKDTATLYYLTNDEAAFVVVDEKVNVTQLSTDCFMRDAQTRHAKQLIVLPISSFYRLAAKVGSPSGQLVFVGNTGRCGSTLLVQIFQETKKVLCLPEPVALEYIVDKLRELPKERCKKLLYCCVNLLCKPQSKQAYEAYILKPMAMTSRLHVLFEDVFPEARHIFMYRDCISNIRSKAKVYSSVPGLRLCLIVGTILPIKKKLESAFFPNETLEKDVEIYRMSTLQLGISAYIWCKTCKMYMDARDHGVPVAALKYEHLLEDPKGTMDKVLSFLALPTEWASATSEAMTLNSQRSGTYMITYRRKVVITEGDKECLNEMLTRNKIPTLDQPCLLPGTITG